MKLTSIAVLLATSVLLASACGGDTAVDPMSEPDLIEADWPVYGSPEEMWERADLVVEVVIEGKGESSALKPTPLSAGDPGFDDPKADPLAGLEPEERAQAELELRDDQSIPITVYTARITTVWKGEPEGDIVEVKQLGNADVSLAADVSYLEADGEYLVFLETYDDSPASILNPWQAQYSMRGGVPTIATHDADEALAFDLSVRDLERLSRTD